MFFCINMTIPRMILSTLAYSSDKNFLRCPGILIKVQGNLGSVQGLASQMLAGLDCTEHFPILLQKVPSKASNNY